MPAPVPLNDRTLRRLPHGVAAPIYDRSALEPAVVHLSVGSFHRSHQAVYFDELAALGHTGWGLTGVGLRRREMAAALLPQDRLYTVVERGPGAAAPRVVGVMGRYLFAPDERRAVVAALADARTKLVTLTVTAAGYCDEPGAGPNMPALLAEALGLRRRRGIAPFTVLSCDNLPANGEAARRAVAAAAARRDPALAEWIEREVAFPSSMVDRITPRTSEDDRRRLAREHGISDRWPVVTEAHREWVIEDRWCNDRPALDEVGVRFVDDVRPWALRKTRTLNAIHVALGALGRAAGAATIGALMADPVFRAYTERMMDEEIAPSLPPVAGSDLGDHLRCVLRRLSNPGIGDGVERLCRDADRKLARHLVPSIAAARADGRSHPLLTLAVAAIARPGAVPGALAADLRFTEEVALSRRSLERLGARDAVAAALAGDSLLAA